MYAIYAEGTGFCASLNLDQMTVADGFTVDALSATDGTTQVVSSAGDVNGDGFEDIMITAGRAEIDGHIDIGKAYLIFGQAGGFPCVLISPLGRHQRVVFHGINAEDRLSRTGVRGIGDMNAGGYAELAFGAAVPDVRGISPDTDDVVVPGGN